jgi:hypothetical protein
LLPINEFARPYQSKNNGIYPACETGELFHFLGLDLTAGAGWINPDPTARRGALSRMKLSASRWS